jgi:hypothetical protein
MPAGIGTVTRAGSSGLMRPLLAGTVAVALAGCGGPGEPLQPLDAGTIWRYEVTAQVGEAVHRSVLEERGLGRLPGAEGAHYGVAQHDGTLSVLARADGGVQRVGIVRTSGAMEPVEPAEWIVPAPGVDTWTIATHTGLIARKVEDFEEAAFRLPVSLELTYRVAGGERRVELPAGTFEGCTEFTGKGGREVVRNRRGQITRVTVEQRDVYCPGVGLVLRERSEQTDNPILMNGSYRRILSELRRR